MTPTPVGPLLLLAQLTESTILVALAPVPLILAVFIAVPGVVVLVGLVVVAFVVLALPVFLVAVVLVLRAGSGHHRHGVARAAVRKSELRNRYPRCTSFSFGARFKCAESRSHHCLLLALQSLVNTAQAG